MAWADAAVAAGGSTAWELAFMGVPAVLLVLVDNQREIARSLSQAKAALNLGAHANLGHLEIARALLNLMIDRVQRQAMSQCGRSLVDGLGSRRVVTALRQ